MSHEIRTPINYLPKEKVQLVTEEGTAPPPEKTSDILPTALFELESIDPVSGIEYCGSEEDYMETLAIFSASIGSKSNKIEKAWQEQDLKNYTILVHSLKSTSRIVGAKALSELAFQLEMAGKAANASLIEERHLSCWNCTEACRNLWMRSWMSGKRREANGGEVEIVQPLA